MRELQTLSMWKVGLGIFTIVVTYSERMLVYTHEQGERQVPQATLHLCPTIS